MKFDGHDLCDGLAVITYERRRQLLVEGFNKEHDAEHKDESMAWVAAIYAAPGIILKHQQASNPYTKFEEHRFVEPWPSSWARRWDKRGKHDRIKQLAIAGALCAAEIDRLSKEEGNVGNDTIGNALEIARRYGSIDGACHKAWVIDQMIRSLTGDNYSKFIANAKDGKEGPETYSWDEGIAP